MQYIHILFVSDEELKRSTLLLANQLKLQLYPFGCNVRAHLLRQNFSSDYSSIRNGPFAFDFPDHTRI